MTLTLDDNAATYQIRAYRPGLIQINEETYTASLIVTPHNLLTTWPPQSLGEVTESTLSPILALKPTIFLLGTGTTLHFPPLEVYGHLLNHGIGVEIMDTHAACRTYNALSAEGRHVAAALIIR